MGDVSNSQDKLQACVIVVRAFFIKEVPFQAIELEEGDLKEARREEG